MITKQFKYKFQIPITYLSVEDVEEFYATHHDMTRFFYYHNAHEFINNYYKNCSIDDWHGESWSKIIINGLNLKDNVGLANDLQYDTLPLIYGVEEVCGGRSALLEAKYLWINFVVNIIITDEVEIINNIDDNFKLINQDNETIEDKYYEIINEINDVLLDNYFNDNIFDVFHQFENDDEAMQYGKQLHAKMQSTVFEVTLTR